MSPALSPFSMQKFYFSGNFSTYRWKSWSVVLRFEESWGRLSSEESAGAHLPKDVVQSSQPWCTHRCHGFKQSFPLSGMVNLSLPPPSPPLPLSLSLSTTLCFPGWITCQQCQIVFVQWERSCTKLWRPMELRGLGSTLSTRLACFPSLDWHVRAPVLWCYRLYHPHLHCSLVLYIATQVEYMTSKYHIYMLKNGRINMCGLNVGNLEYVSNAIKDAVISNPENWFVLKRSHISIYFYLVLLYGSYS